MTDYPTPMQELERALDGVMNGKPAKDILTLVPANQQLAVQLLVGQAIADQIERVWMELEMVRGEVQRVADQIATGDDEIVAAVDGLAATVRDGANFLPDDDPPVRGRWGESIRAWVHEDRFRKLVDGLARAGRK